MGVQVPPRTHITSSLPAAIQFTAETRAVTPQVTTVGFNSLSDTRLRTYPRAPHPLTHSMGYGE